MKKVFSMLAVAAFLFSLNASAQEEPKQTKKAKAATEKSCTKEEKKSCGTEKKASCCSAKKEESKS
jgi:hypothetical protein